MNEHKATYQTAGGRRVVWQRDKSKSFQQRLAFDAGQWLCHGCGDRGWPVERLDAQTHASQCRQVS